MTEQDQAVPEASRATGREAGPRSPSTSAGVLRKRGVGPTAVIALAALIGLAVWLVIESRGGSGSKNQSNAFGPKALSLSGLRSFAGKVSQPIYWVGSRPDTMYEVTRNSTGIYVRYLPTGVKAGDPKPFLTIGTYPFANAYAATKTGSKGPGTMTVDIKGGGIAAYNKKHRTNVYVAYPGSAFQVEVYAPNRAVPRRLAASGIVQPVLKAEQTQARGPVAASPQELSSIPASVGHAVYWAGSRANTTYELWQTSSGYTYIRYLPRGVAVGSEGGRYLIVASYPMTNAYRVTRNSGVKGKSTVRLTLPNGGIAAYTKQHATNIYVAYRGVNVQVEVYDPSPGAAARIVKSGRIVPLG